MADRGKTPMTADEEYQETRANKRRAIVTTDGLRRLETDAEQRAIYDPSYRSGPPAPLQFPLEDCSSLVLPQPPVSMVLNITVQMDHCYQKYQTR